MKDPQPLLRRRSRQRPIARLPLNRRCIDRDRTPVAKQLEQFGLVIGKRPAQLRSDCSVWAAHDQTLAFGEDPNPRVTQPCQQIEDGHTSISWILPAQSVAPRVAHCKTSTCRAMPATVGASN